MISLPLRFSLTGNRCTASTSSISSPLDSGRIDQLFREIRKPVPMPRNEPSSTKLVKYDRCSTFDPSQRISASSMNSITELPSTSRTMTARSLCPVTGAGTKVSGTGWVEVRTPTQKLTAAS